MKFITYHSCSINYTRFFLFCSVYVLGVVERLRGKLSVGTCADGAEASGTAQPAAAAATAADRQADSVEAGHRG